MPKIFLLFLGFLWFFLLAGSAQLHASPVAAPNDTNSVILFSDCVAHQPLLGARPLSSYSCEYQYANFSTPCKSTYRMMLSYSSSDEMVNLYPGSASVYTFNGSHYFKVLPLSLTTPYRAVFDNNQVLTLPGCTWWSGSDSRGKYAGNACKSWTSYSSTLIAGAMGTPTDVFDSVRSCGEEHAVVCGCYTGPEYSFASSASVRARSLYVALLCALLGASIGAST